MWVLKIGGSWITNPNLITLIKRLEKKKKGKIIIVAGGGCFADSVRSGTFPFFRAHGDAVLRTGTFRHRCPSSFNPLQGPR